MAIGRGRYDDLTTYVREASGARRAVVIILGGYKGNGFDLQVASNVTEALAGVGSTFRVRVRGWEIGAYEFGTVVVDIDIKPGGEPNSINPKNNKEVIPVAVLTTGAFDASTVDPTTVRFGRTGTEAAAVRSALEDVDLDGDTDLVLRFKTRDTGIVCGDTVASLTGETVGGQAIEGADAIKTVSCN